MADRKTNLLAEIEADVLSDRPLAGALRKCVILGGRAGSVELRDWATRELRGYTPGKDVPGYRTVPAPIFADAFTGNAIVKHQRISPSLLPDFAKDDIKEEFTFYNGIGEIEAMIRGDDSDQVRLGLPMALDLARVMDKASDNRFQHITSLYWGVSKSSLRGIVDQVKTTLTELVSRDARRDAGGPVDPLCRPCGPGHQCCGPREERKGHTQHSAGGQPRDGLGGSRSSRRELSVLDSREEDRGLRGRTEHRWRCARGNCAGHLVTPVPGDALYCGDNVRALRKRIRNPARILAF